MTCSKFIQSNYETHEWRHATAILRLDFPQELAEIQAVLEAFRLRKSWIEVVGGRKSKVAEFIDSHLVTNRSVAITKF